MSSGRFQMLAMTVVAIVVTIATFVYLLAAPPAYLRESSSGVPYFTPPVLNPMTNKPMSVDSLVQDYKGKGVSSGPAGLD
jgi:hypothetical protein